MKKLLVAIVAALTLSTTAVVTSPTPTQAAAQITCKRNIMANGQFRASCSKFGGANERWYHRVRVVCNNGLYDIAHDGPTRYTYAYPTDNWSYSWGCAVGEQFRYYQALSWMA